MNFTLLTNNRGKLLGIKPLETWRRSFEIDQEEYLSPGTYSLVPDGQGYWRRRKSLESCIRLISCTNIGVVDANYLERWCTESVAIAHDAVFEEYERNDCDPRKNMPVDEDDLHWVEVFRYGVFFALLGSDFDSAKKFGHWVKPHFPHDETMFDFTKSDNIYFKLLGNLIAAPTLNTPTETVKQAQLTDCREKRCSNLYTSLIAIFNNDAATFEVSITNLLKSYLSSGLDRDCLDSFFSIDGTTLWLLARFYEIRLPNLPEKLNSLIVTRETLGLEK